MTRKISVNLTDTIETWRQATNSMSNYVGEPDQLITTNKSDIVSAINEIAPQVTTATIRSLQTLASGGTGSHTTLVYDSNSGAWQFNCNTITQSDLGPLSTSAITSGVFPVARIPNLATNKITSGVFDKARIPHIQNLDGQLADSQVGFVSDDVPQGTSHIYYTDSLARSALSAGQNISYSQLTGVIQTNRAIPEDISQLQDTQQILGLSLPKIFVDSAEPLFYNQGTFWYDDVRDTIQIQGKGLSGWATIAHIDSGASKINILNQTNVVKILAQDSVVLTGILSPQDSSIWVAGTSTLQSLVSPYDIKRVVDGTGIGADGIDSDALLAMVDSAYVGARITVPAEFDSADVVGIVDSAYLAARVSAGFDSADVVGIVDSAYVAARVVIPPAFDSADASFVAGNLIDSAYVAARVTVPAEFDSADASFVAGNLIDSAYVAARVNIPAAFDSADVVGIVDSAYVAARVSAGTDSAAIIGLVDSAYVAARVNIPAAFDSGDVVGIVDSAYVAARVTVPAEFDSADVVGIVDSAYVAARTTAGTDSASIINMIDSAYVQAREDNGWATISGTPTTIGGYGITDAFDGAYNSLTGKPTLFDGAYSSLSGIPSTFTPDSHSQSWSTITSTPTTISGYGITDGYSNSDVDTHINQSNPTSGYVLSWNGTDYAWVAQSAGGGSTSLDGLTDVSTSGVTSGQVLKYNGTSWAPDDDDVASGGNLGNLTVAASTISSSGTTITLDDDVIVTGSLTSSQTGSPILTSATSLTLQATTRTSIANTPLKLHNFTTTQRNALSAATGDMIYNSTTNKFQGFANGSWVDLH